MLQWLKHAFAVEKPGPATPTPEQKLVVDRVCAEIVRRRLTAPTTVTLETMRPLNFMGAQVLHFLSPFISTMVESDAHDHLAAFLEHRGSIDYLCDLIEELEDRRKQSLKPEQQDATEHLDIATSP